MNDPKSSTASPPAPAGPPCARRHPGAGAEVESAWYCKDCDAPLCRQCVHVYGSREGRYASCKKCGSRCEPILTKAPPIPLGEETFCERQARRRRHHIAPRITLGGVAAIQLIVASIAFDPLPAVLTLPVWVVIGAAIYAAVLYKLELETEDIPGLVFKAGAMALAVHAARLIAMTVLGLQLPEATDVAGGYMAMISLLLPLAICFVLVPAALIACFVGWWFDADASETIFVIIALYLAESFTFALLKIGGLPG